MCLLKIAYMVTADCGLGRVSVEWSTEDVTITVEAGDSYLASGHLLTSRVGRMDVYLGMDLGNRRIRGAAQPDSKAWSWLVPTVVPEEIARLTV